MPFRNPYHFVPVQDHIPGQIPSPTGQPLNEDNLGHRSFHRYHEDTYSGRLICTLSTQSPLVIGAAQEEDAEGGYTRVRQFERNGRPEIPASTLRGCVSSLAEAASNSALRVLEGRNRQPYSRRETMDEETGSAIGLIVQRDGEFRLLPLSLSTLQSAENGSYSIPPKYRRMFPNARLKALCFQQQTLTDAPPTYSYGRLCYYYAQLQGKYTMHSGCLHEISKGYVKNDRFLLGLRVQEEPVTSPPEGQEENFVRGILRVISSLSREEEMPPTKKHEMFIPLPEDMERTGETFHIQDSALEQFQRLAQGRESENDRRSRTLGGDMLPFALKGGNDIRSRNPQYSLQEGDIVFFEPNNSGDEVQRIWISQIWRKEIPGNAHTFFSQINPELLPYNKDRQTVTPAEALFGFVEVEDRDASQDRHGQARALAGRVGFQNARLMNSPENGPYNGQEIPLQILASPKPPSPSLYFRPRKLPNTQQQQRQAKHFYIAKKELDPQKHRPQGRKMYLHHSENDIFAKARTGRREENQNQKNLVQPLVPGCEFTFSVDFDNLDDWELGLLMYALQPGEEFLHKIGMAKPLGFGSVKIKVEGLFLIDRQDRYQQLIDSDDALCPRYHRYWLHQNCAYSLPEVEQAKERISDDAKESPQNLIKEVAATLDPEINQALQTLGRPMKHVRYPEANNQDNREQEHFKWFQNNDQAPEGQGQGLVPVACARNAYIETLTENDEP